MQVGEMRERITIQQYIKEDNPFGQGSWQDYKTIWAKKEWVKGEEFWSAQANNSGMTVKYVVRFRKDIDSSMRIKDRDGIYELVAPPQPFNTRDYMIIMCKEVKPSA